MPVKKPLNSAALESLGAERLAKLLIEISADNPGVKRRLRLELAAAESPSRVVNEIRKRLATIARSRSFVDWQNRRALVQDLEMQRRSIVEQVANRDSVAALDLMWQFLKLANGIFERSDDSSGTLVGIFRSAVGDLGAIAASAKPDPEHLAADAVSGLIENHYGQYDDLIQVLAPALGRAGLEGLKRRMAELSSQPATQPKQREIVGYGVGGPLHADEVEDRSRRMTIRLALMAIADAQGDVDAHIGQYDERARKMPKIAAEIAQRLLAAGRAQEALKVIESTEGQDRWNWPEFEWEDARIEVFEALGRADEAQAARWSCFERSLSVSHLRAYLKRLADFEDFEAEQRALDHATGYSSVLQALAFLVAWPALDRAAALVLRHASNLDGDHYEILTQAGDALSAKYPLAATLVLRAMVDFSLTQGRSNRYRHAARHLEECASLARQIEDLGDHESHDAYVRRLRAQHGRKYSFWELYSA